MAIEIKDGQSASKFIQTTGAGTSGDPFLIKSANSDAIKTAVEATQTGIGATNETAPASDTAASGLNGRLQRIAQRLTALIALLPASLGQKNKAGSLAVVLASDQDALPVSDGGGSLTVDGSVSVSGTVVVDGSAVTQPVSATALPLPTGAATAANQATGNTSLASLDTKLGEVQASPTANTVLDRLKQIATALAGTLTVATHAVTQSGAWSVSVASLPTLPAGDNNIGNVDIVTMPNVTIGAALPAGTNNIGDVDVLTLPALPAGTNNIGDVDVVSLPAAATGTVTNVISSATSGTILAASTARKGAMIFNDSTALLYLKFASDGSAASATAYSVRVAAGGFYELTLPYTGIITGIWAAANGAARVTELT